MCQMIERRLSIGIRDIGSALHNGKNARLHIIYERSKHSSSRHISARFILSRSLDFSTVFRVKLIAHEVLTSILRFVDIADALRHRRKMIK